ncbi:MAG: extracellular solute-binding protein, partial [Gemmiger sp.]
KRVAEDITARREELGFSAFTSAGLSTSSDWRFRTHLANLPLYYEFRDRGLGLPDSVPRVEGLYLDNYKAIFDLYLQNATCPPTELISKSGEDSLQEFLNREAVFYQNGSWEYAHLTGEGGLRDEEMTMLPIYIGVEGEESQGLCTGTENYWCVNRNASEVDRQATLDFLYWCVTSPTGTAALAWEMHFAIPFRQAQPTDNIFLQQDLAMTAAGKTPVDWCFYTMPSTKWKSSLGSALAAYACGKKGWEGVRAAFVDGWGAETALLEK